MPILSSPEYDLFAFFFCLYLFYQLFMMTDGEGNGPVNLINHVYPNMSEQDKIKRKTKTNGTKNGDDDVDYTNKELFHMIKDLIRPKSGEVMLREEQDNPEADQQGQQKTQQQPQQQSRQGPQPAQPPAPPAPQPESPPAAQPQTLPATQTLPPSLPGPEPEPEPDITDPQRKE